MLHLLCKKSKLSIKQDSFDWCICRPSQYLTIDLGYIYIWNSFSCPLLHPVDLVYSKTFICHYNDVIMGAMASQITSFTIVYSTVCSGADERKYQSSASLAFVRGIHRCPVNSPHIWPVTRKMFPFDDVIMAIWSVLRGFMWLTNPSVYGCFINTTAIPH